MDFETTIKKKDVVWKDQTASRVTNRLFITLHAKGRVFNNLISF